MTDEETFKSWLVEHNYSPASVESYVGILRAMKLGQQSKRMRYGVRLIIACFPNGPLHQQAMSLMPLLNEKKEEFGGRVGKIKKKIDGFDNDRWQDILGGIKQWAQYSRAAAVLALMAETGLRIGDVLRITQMQLAKGYAQGLGVFQILLKGDKPIAVKHSIAPVEWHYLFTELTRTNSKDIAHWVAPGGDGSPLAGHAAYTAVKRELQHICADVGITDRVFLHRIRKTVGEQLYAATGDATAVRDALGHSHAKTSEKYINEHHADRVADAHALRRKMFEGKK